MIHKRQVKDDIRGMLTQYEADSERVFSDVVIGLAAFGLVPAYEHYFDKTSMEHYVAAASDPKKVLYYDTGHDLNDPQAFTDRYGCLVKYINLRREPPLQVQCAALAEARIAVPCGWGARSANVNSSVEGHERRTTL
jgi:hypothetical protein